ncbi:iron uptake porin [Microcoleus sp. FACHB-68]|uniref:iron uptake porin n=1 Tax=Microcoleus sp. FACHB-68 TaxID=2692826 RepID=UPI001F551B1D|nr:iron uptake porin [Microcoleus sp. FACHB-68]
MMPKIFRAAFLYKSAVLGAILVVTNSALAVEAPAGEKDAEKIAAADPIASSVENNDRQTQQTGELLAVNAPDQLLSVKATSVPAGRNLLAELPSDGTLPSETSVPAEPSVSSLDGMGQANEEVDPMAQLSDVNQLSDVQPTDWAYEALRNLVERYNCIAGYPDGTFRGNRAMTRYEFAAGLNACLDAILALIPEGGDFATQEDLAILRRLLDEFQAELATLRGRVDALEARTSELEANQFSTTTKLRGEVIFAGSDIIGEGGSSVPHFTHRTRLNLDTSFTGKDLLRARLQVGNTEDLTAFGGTPMDRLAFEANTENQLQIHKLFYRFPLTSRATVIVDANQGEYNENVFVFNPALESSGRGSVSRFGRFNPIYRQGGGQGLTLNYDFSKALGVSLSYHAPNGNDPDPAPGGGGGFFSGSYAALGQVTFRPSNRFALGLTYVNSYSRNGSNLSGGTGSSLANRPFGTVPTSANHYGVEASVSLSPRFIISGWGGLTDAQQESGGDADAKIINWALSLAFPDLGKEGNLAAFIIGMPPKVTESDATEDRNTYLHLEALYRYQVTDNIAITPGLFVILDPEHNDSNETDFVGTVRTTFTF